ncbi:TetR/AcrR family transcriptional regulator [Amycolatopsis minnesotensis]|uniref:TetR/AcrR family transcriptional regulator n=1 Tax=Amycolatopsis minnesotensis TaxID=337894 RepID=A0ABN2R6U3_9PSEU
MTSPIALRGQEVRRRLLRAAVELIPERGWSAVSTRLLAERAGVTPGVVHYHFSSVRELLSQAALGTMREMLSGVHALFEQARSATDAVDTMLAALEEYSGRDPASMVFTETYLAATRDDDLRHAMTEIVADFRRRFADALARWRVPDPAGTAAVVAATIDGILLHRGLDPGLTAASIGPVLRRLVPDAKTVEEDAG